MRGVPTRVRAMTTARITSSTMRCNTLRSPSRPCHTPEKNARAVMPAPVLELLLDPGRLAGQVTQVVELRAPHVAAALHGDLADRRAVGLEHPLDALAVGDLAHCERGVQSAVAAGNDDTLVRLHALAIAFHYLHLHHH